MGWICNYPYKECEKCRFVTVTLISYVDRTFMARCETHICPHGHELLKDRYITATTD